MSKGSGFYITGGKGFHIVFENGWTISVQFGPGNYCSNRDMDIFRDSVKAGEQGSSVAEIAYWGPDGEMQKFGEDGDTVKGWVPPAEVLALMNDISARSNG